MIIGTAGHIDHGKSALVEALTGRGVDRLREERARGITIDLNFAPLELEGTVAGVVDVPGHEDFVRTMVAGAAGMDVVLLVVAADEGIMPQTREHLDVVEQLDVPFGIPVITKCDLATPEWIGLVEEELRERLAASTVRFGPVHRVSARDGAGIASLRLALADIARVDNRRDASDLLRLPVDRVFSVAGTGTVVTGTLWTGSVAAGDTVRFLTSGRSGRVRTVQRHGVEVERGVAGQRIAVGLSGVSRDGLGRGEMLVREGDPWALTSVIDAHVRLVPGATKTLRMGTRVRLHLGTAEVMARVSPRKAIAPGEEGMARLHLESPLACRGGDRFVLRSYSPVGTVGGGRILDPLASRDIRAWPAGLDDVDPAARLDALAGRRRNGVLLADLPILLGVPANWTASADGRSTIAGDRIVPSDRLRRLAGEASRLVEEFHRDHPALPGIPLETLRSSLRAPPGIVEAAIDAAGREGRVTLDGSVVRRPGHAARVPGGEARLDHLMDVIRSGGLTPPSLGDLGGEREGVEAALRIAEGRGLVSRVDRDHFYGREALEGWTRALTEVGDEGEITPAALRERLGLSRKFLIPLLEWSDRTGITRRIGERRVLVSPLSRGPAEI